ncbi:glutathionylspermidine synthase family protein [Alteromonas flava]|uniref:glutathionylspermidine synthase family protein n=1 Tax=Alteromonas flava TaxID=2048003 RepID=UPI000C289812|nr:glutathionylspermidine synthase family protein [Alteromonas flava]
MLRIPIAERPRWRQRAAEFGFHFHTMYGEPYWDESAYYQFTLAQIETDIEDPTAQLHQMCLAAVATVVNSDEWLRRFQIPETFWDPVRESWHTQQPSLYSRLDLVYDGKSPAKLLENNADTPTSLYESGFWQWLWLEDNVQKGALPRQCDQFNSLQERLIQQLRVIANYYQCEHMHFSCCQDTEEDRGTVQYLQDCASDAGLQNSFVYIEDIGLAEDHSGKLIFSDLDDAAIACCFKLYPWEFMLREEFASSIVEAKTRWIEPLWKSILSNKALLPLLWQLYPDHPNLLPAYFSADWQQLSHAEKQSRWVKKPIFSREGANISVIQGDAALLSTDGPYGEEGFIMQAHHALPRYADNYTLIGSWLVNDQPAGISVREDTSPITQDLSRYMPHVILG